MGKRLIIILICLSSIFSLGFIKISESSNNCDIALSEKNEVRELFFKASYDQPSFTRLTSCLDQSIFDNPTYYMAYHGALEVLKARYKGGFFKKLNLISSGKAQLDKAIEKAPGNLEIRFLRFAVTYHLPNLLQDSKKYTNDKSYIIDHIQQIHHLDMSQNFKDQLLAFMKETECFSQTEMSKLEIAIYTCKIQQA